MPSVCNNTNRIAKSGGAVSGHSYATAGAATLKNVTKATGSHRDNLLAVGGEESFDASGGDTHRSHHSSHLSSSFELQYYQVADVSPSRPEIYKLKLEHEANRKVRVSDREDSDCASRRAERGYGDKESGVNMAGGSSRAGSGWCGSQAIRCIGIVGFITILVFVVWVYLLQEVPTQKYIHEFLVWIESLGYMGPIIAAMFYAVLTVVLIPGTFLNVGAGFMFGIVVGYLSVAIGSMFGASIAFFIARFLCRERVQKMTSANSHFAVLENALMENETAAFKIILLSRLPPLFPFTFLNYAFGVTRVSFPTYCIASLLGLFPSTLMDAYVGSAFRTISEGGPSTPQMAHGGSTDNMSKDSGFFYLGLIVTVLVTAYITWKAKCALDIATASSRRGDGEDSFTDEDSEDIALEMQPEILGSSYRDSPSMKNKTSETQCPRHGSGRRSVSKRTTHMSFTSTHEYSQVQNTDSGEEWFSPPPECTCSGEHLRVDGDVDLEASSPDESSPLTPARTR
eukprot:GFYU01002042.1.p1 GENE.GFYU01002042.1~~GFYU01002042.1.p1  ORF type:complete len:512 (-),score=110.60 GFYU01002042.1:341-1876(-)